MEQTTVVQQICHNLGIAESDLARQRGSGRLALHSVQSARGTGKIGRCIDLMRRAVGAADGDEEIFTACLTDVRTAINAVLNNGSDSGDGDTTLMVRGDTRPILRIPNRR
jgi:hypothetical protein